jgi:DNA sulfur modification protein DndB
VLSEAEYYLAPIVSFFKTITDEERKEIRTNYGSGGKTKVWRTFQKIIAAARLDFQPEGLAQWVKDNTKQFNVQSFEMIHDLERTIKQVFATKLEEKYGSKWLTAGLPPKVYKQANNIMGKQNYDNSVNGLNKSVSIWDCTTISNCKDIATFGPNWMELFERSFTRPEELKLTGGKAAKTEWISKLATIASNNSTNYSVTEEEFLFLKALHDWLIE